MKDRLLLILALVSGAIATLLAFIYIQSASAVAEDEAPRTTLEILYVKTDLAADEVIDPDVHLEPRTIVIEEMPHLRRAAIKATERTAVAGRPVAIPVPAGVPLMYAHLTEVKDFDLPLGTRAMAINVESTSLMGGLLLPGDRVDILYSHPEPPPTADPVPYDLLKDDPKAAEAYMKDLRSRTVAQTNDRWVTETVLRGIRIIAVGNRLSGSRQAQLFGVSGGSTGRTVTIEVTEDQAKELIEVQAGGKNKLTLLLLPEGETEWRERGYSGEQ